MIITSFFTLITFTLFLFISCSDSKTVGPFGLFDNKLTQALAALDADEYMAVARRVAAARERFGGEREALMRHMFSRGFTVDEAQQAICTDA